ncbi:MAG: MerR family transcriptional regulator [Clostridiales bacterium]|nr:MerR family transcriptional regulator [Clostridiales bacterium]
MYYTVNDVAKISNISPHTIRFYSKEGLLPHVKRNEYGVRMFQSDDFEWLFVIESLKKSGMSIKDIREYIELCAEGDATIGERLNRFKRQQEVVESKIAELQEILQVVRYKRWRYEVSFQAGTIAVHQTMNPQDTPEEFRAIAEKLEKMKEMY